MPTQFPPGWYRDPSDARRVRYWNGRHWTRDIWDATDAGHVTFDGPVPPLNIDADDPDDDLDFFPSARPARRSRRVLRLIGTGSAVAALAIAGATVWRAQWRLQPLTHHAITSLVHADGDLTGQRPRGDAASAVTPIGARGETYTAGDTACRPLFAFLQSAEHSLSSRTADVWARTTGPTADTVLIAVGRHPDVAGSAIVAASDARCTSFRTSRFTYRNLVTTMYRVPSVGDNSLFSVLRRRAGRGAPSAAIATLVVRVGPNAVIVVGNQFDHPDGDADHYRQVATAYAQRVALAAAPRLRALLASPHLRSAMVFNPAYTPLDR